MARDDEARDRAGTLRLRLLDENEKPLSERVEIRLSHRVLSDRHLLKDVDASETIEIEGLRPMPQGTYKLQIDAPSYRQVGRFIRIQSDGYTDLTIQLKRKEPAGTVDVERPVEPSGFAARHRSTEWRDNWFRLGRGGDDRVLGENLRSALELKRQKIASQIDFADHLAAYAPAGAGTPWFSIGPRNINGRVKSLAVDPTDPDVVYAGAASGGVWKSIDAAQSWRPLWNEQESLAIGSIALAPSAPDTIYAGTGEWTPGWGPSYPGAGVFASTDGGGSWTQHSGVNASRIARVLVSPTDPSRVYVAGNQGFERSLNDGADWATIRSGEISDAVVDPSTSPDTLYINVRNDGIYKSLDGGDSWAKLTSGPTGSGADWIRLAIGVAGTHGTDFLLAKRSGAIHRSTDGGATWATLAGSHGASSYHAWCNLIAVAPSNENVILAGGVGAERTSNGGTSWSALSGLHSDHHRAVFAPSSPSVVYTCNDGGVYRSTDQGANWKKTSHGLVVTQFYDIGSWDPISTVLGGGTQDQGTNMSTGGLTWRKILGGDGGYFVIHPSDPRTIYSEHQNTALRKSTDGGNSWTNITSGLSGGNPWTGVLTMDLNNPNTLFVGTTLVFRTTNGATTPWTASSQALGSTVTSIAIAPSNSNRVYAGTASGKVFRSDDGGATSPWADKTAAPLPSRALRDVVVDFTTADRVIATFAGSGSGRVCLSTDGGNSWNDISSDLPNISVNAAALDPNDANTIYVGTDAGAYRTTDLGVSWLAFDNGMPNVIVTDLHIDPEDELLVASTMGRGMYKVSITNALEPEVDLYLRDSILDTGERLPSPSNLPNPNDVSDQVYWWESPDIKVDVSPFYSPDALFDGVEFDADLVHEDPRRTESNRFYLQVHNRGWKDATNVRVRAFLADASAGLPPLPNALAPPNFNLSSTVNWTPIGAAQTIPVLEPNRPVIVSWDFTVPSTAATHSCLMAVASSAEDPITTTETVVHQLIKNEKRVCLKNLHVVDSEGPRFEQNLVAVNFHNVLDEEDLIDVVIQPVDYLQGNIGLLLETVDVDPATALEGVTVYPLAEGEDVGRWYLKPGSAGPVDPEPLWQGIDRSRVFEFDIAKASELRGLRLGPGQSLRGVITLQGSHKVAYGQRQRFAVLQRQAGEIVGGSTYELRLRRAADLHPVSRIRVVLEKVRILDDHDPCIRGRGEFSFSTCVGFNDERCRRHWRRLPQKRYYKISDWPKHNELELDECIFDGFVAESDNMLISILPNEADWPDPDDAASRYLRRFNGPPENWVGRYAPNDELPDRDSERMADWMVWYRVESVRL